MTPASTTPSSLLVYLLFVALATYRLTRLAIRDTITARARGWIQIRYTGPLVNTFTRCTWCISVWFAAGLTVAGWWLWPHPWFRLTLLALAAAAIAGFVADKEG